MRWTVFLGSWLLALASHAAGTGGTATAMVVAPVSISATNPQLLAVAKGGVAWGEARVHTSRRDLVYTVQLSGHIETRRTSGALAAGGQTLMLGANVSRVPAGLDSADLPLTISYE